MFRKDAKMLHSEKITNSNAQFLSIDRSANCIDAVLYFLFLKDHRYHIAYIPSLDISGYGDNREEAEEMVLDALNTYFSNISDFTEDKLQDELTKYGWKKDKYRRNKFVGAYVDAQGVLKNFDLPDQTKISEELISISG